MKSNTYVIRITTIDNLYADYIVEADNLFSAKMLARRSFFRDYPEADRNLKMSLNDPHSKEIVEIMNIIKEANN